jgi:type IV pilus assembly protein PilA
MLKLALSEYYVSTGKWPANAQQAGLGPAESFAGGAVSRIEVGTNGAIIVTLNDTLAAGARIRLQPDANLQGGTINWRCSTEGAEALRRFRPPSRRTWPMPS